MEVKDWPNTEEQQSFKNRACKSWKNLSVITIANNSHFNQQIHKDAIVSLR